jgi:hypothetical protein
MIAALRSVLLSLSSDASRSLEKWNDDLERKLLQQGNGCPPFDEQLDTNTTIRAVANELHLSTLNTFVNAINDYSSSSSSTSTSSKVKSTPINPRLLQLSADAEAAAAAQGGSSTDSSKKKKDFP